MNGKQSSNFIATYFLCDTSQVNRTVVYAHLQRTRTRTHIHVRWWYATTATVFSCLYVCAKCQHRRFGRFGQTTKKSFFFSRIHKSHGRPISICLSTIPSSPVTKQKQQTQPKMSFVLSLGFVRFSSPFCNWCKTDFTVDVVFVVNSKHYSNAKFSTSTVIAEYKPISFRFYYSSVHRDYSLTPTYVCEVCRRSIQKEMATQSNKIRQNIFTIFSHSFSSKKIRRILIECRSMCNVYNVYSCEAPFPFTKNLNSWVVKMYTK